jgi:hypothetical protein
MVLQQVVDVKFKQASVLSDNTPTVAWTKRMANKSQSPTVKVIKSMLKPKKPLRRKSQTLVLAGYPNPWRSYGSKHLNLPFSCIMKTYKNANPAPKPQLALPVRAIQCIVAHYCTNPSPQANTIADLLTIAFFFILCPGKSTMHPSHVSAHSMVSGAMSLQLKNVGKDLIKKLGRWSSDTWLTYIHSQISSLTAGLSECMMIHHVFYNIGSL